MHTRMNRTFFKRIVLGLFTFLFTFLLQGMYGESSGAVYSGRITERTSVTMAQPHVLTVGDNVPQVLALHQMLATLGYLPIQFHSVVETDNLYPLSRTYPRLSTWDWRFKNIPESLKALWDPNRYNVITRGAVMTFQLEHHLPVDGFAGPAFFSALDEAYRLGMYCRHPYTNVIVKQSVPQAVLVWREGRIVFQTICSTGKDTAKTHVGTHVIYLRNRLQTMSGDTPSGGRYRVDNVPYVSFFFKGEALHGLKRPLYGIPQSMGCVETPIAAARQIWRLTDYGTLVTVQSPSE